MIGITMKDVLGTSMDWPVSTVAVGVTDATANQLLHGAINEILQWASVTKLLTAMATLVAIEEQTVSLDDKVGPPGSTLRHLLAHASGLSTDSQEIICPPGTRRIYSNIGFEILADHVSERAEMPFGEYLSQAVFEPLEMTSTRLEGSPASAALGTVDDLLKLGTELLRPTIISPSTLAGATSVAFAGLAGVLPGFGNQTPNDWGLGFEIRNNKSPHWTGHSNSENTFGHFGRAGGFLWVDPDVGLACACLSDQPFGPWATRSWPIFSDAVLQSWNEAGRTISS